LIISLGAVIVAHNGRHTQTVSFALIAWDSLHHYDVHFTTALDWDIYNYLARVAG
jgi:hypothetical protein